jgi:hypothetical protein
MSARDRDPSAPCALLQRSLITLAITASELSLLIGTPEKRAIHAANNPDQIDYADFLFRRIAEPREAAR